MIYEKNICELKDYRPQFYNKIKAENLAKRLNFNVRTTTAKDGNPVLEIEKEQHLYRLNSMYRPLAEVKRWCEQYQFQNLGINVTMFGMGNLLFVCELLKRMKADSKLYLYEPEPEVFDYILHMVDMTFLITDKRVFLYVSGVNEKEFYYDLAKQTHWSNLAMQIHCCHPKYEEIFPKEYEIFCKWILQCDTTEIVNRNTGVFFAKAFTENSIRNLPFLLESNSIFEFLGKFDTELPAIIVAAGPSLDKNIDILKKAEGKSFMIATDTAVRHLVKAGVKFDCMITVDPKKPERYMAAPECQKLPLFCSLESNFNIMHQHRGKKIWFRDAGEYLTKLYHKFGKEFSMLKAGGNVAAGAWTICRTLGFRRIVFVGQDLAYGENGTHAGGGVDGVTKDVGDVILTKGIFGNEIQTREDWRMYLEWFEREIADCENKIDVIDATEGGALIHGSSVMTLQEVVDKYCTRKGDVAEIFDDMPASFSENLVEVKKELLHMQKEFQDLSFKTEEILHEADKALVLLGEKPVKMYEFEYYAKKISKTNEWIGKQSLFMLLLRYIDGKSVEILKNMNVVTDNVEQDRYDMVVMMQEYYKIVKVILKEIEPFVAEAIETIKRA